MTTKARAGMEELALRVQAALSLATKKEAELLVNIFVSCLEDTLVQHLPEDGFLFQAKRIREIYRPPQTLGAQEDRFQRRDPRDTSEAHGKIPHSWKAASA